MSVPKGTPGRLVLMLIGVLIANAIGGYRWLSRASITEVDNEPRTLRVAVWEDYIAPVLIDQFNRANACRVEITTFTTNEELLTRLMREDERFDLIVPSSYIIPELASLELIDELIRDELKQKDVIDSNIDALAFPKDAVTAKGKAYLNYGVPFVIAQTGIAASTTAGIPNEKLHSWHVFEMSELRGKATLLHDMRETFAAALLAMRKDVNAVDSQTLADASRLIAKWLTVAQFNDDSYAAELPTGRLWVAHAYPGDVGHIVGGDRSIQFLVPDEGGSISIEYMCIVRNSPNTALAYKFVDHLLQIENASANMEWSNIRSASTVAYKHFVRRLEGKPNPIQSPLDTVPPELVLRPLLEADYKQYKLLWRTLVPMDVSTRGVSRD